MVTTGYIMLVISSLKGVGMAGDQNGDQSS